MCCDTSACFLKGRNTVSLPLRDGRNEVARQVQLEVLQRFEYDANMMMSGVIVKSNSTTRRERAQVLVRGAPFEISQLAEPDSLPPDWTQVSSHHCCMFTQQHCTAQAAGLWGCLACMASECKQQLT